MGVLAFAPGKAWIRYYVPEDELVSRSDSVVIGHLVGPVKTVKVGSSPFPGREPIEMDEFRAELLITEVLRGHQEKGETPLIIHYGLRPVRLVAKTHF